MCKRGVNVQENEQIMVTAQLQGFERQSMAETQGPALSAIEHA